ncbi:hypothetical protein CPB83DRAFT_304861 [Crepidotus variabilis]|uniref:Uncharacterized protein n=1 Tax=Crepidotus variabilis TaxID=179855 RepID=A0A9P6EGE2_9AGAR|nr:hypothetical protein CPB83DRAFT_304861 [Crepidotus variabilis]
MATQNQFPLNELPIELQREVFILAAYRDRGSAIRLVHVARRFHHWISPRLYDIVTLGSSDTDLFLRTVQSRPDADTFFTNHVKRLCLSVSVTPRNAEHILSACNGVNDLAFWVDYLTTSPNRSIGPLLSSLPLNRLSVEVRHFGSIFRDPDIRYTWFDTLTHLDIIFWHHELSPSIPHIEKLSSLTHLAMRLRHNQASENSLMAILSAARKLKILIIYDESDSAEEAIWATDSRVVFLPYPFEVVHDWESQAMDEESCSWKRAEELVRRKASEQQG